MASLASASTFGKIGRHCRRIAPPRSLAGLRRAVAEEPEGFALESSVGGDGQGRYSYFGSRPRVLLTVTPSCDPLAALAEMLRPWRAVGAGPVPFLGGWVGFVAYEAGGWVEPTARSTRWLPGLPAARWGRYEAVIAADHATGEWWVVAAEAAELDRLEALTRRSVEPHSAVVPLKRARSDLTRAEYVAAIERILEYLLAGDAYQVNFAQRLSGPAVADVAALYERLCRSNPATLAALVPAGPEWTLLSSSPELFLDVAAGCGGRCMTRPIKGTRRRTGDAAADAATRAELAAGEKESAELAMIVDLVRNDLGRVCEYGTVRVEEAGAIEEQATVMHRVATVSGVLRPECDALDLLRAAFPGGSVTGAPKVRAMQIIDELERSPRGAYCGALGYIGPDGAMRLNLPIRTLMAGPAGVHASVGGGIVADSTPAGEYDETLAKAAGLLRAMGCEPPTDEP